MNTYHIHCAPQEQKQVIEILRRHKDVIINQADDTSVGFTIEQDNPEADAYYQHLVEVINRELHLAIH